MARCTASTTAIAFGSPTMPQKVTNGTGINRRMRAVLHCDAYLTHLLRISVPHALHVGYHLDKFVVVRPRLHQCNSF